MIRVNSRLNRPSPEKSKNPGDDPDEKPEEKEAESADEQADHPYAALSFGKQGDGESDEP
jgi:hypothetical protein